MLWGLILEHGIQMFLKLNTRVELIGMHLDNSCVGTNLLWCPLGSDKPNHFVPLIESYKRVKCNGKRKRTSTETSIATPSTSKYSQKSVSDYFEKSFEEVRIISLICKEVQDGLSSPTNAITCEASCVGGVVEQSKCFDVCTFRNQLCDAKAGQGDVLSLKMDLIKNVFKPDREFVFPLMGKRKFVRDWLDIYISGCAIPH